MKNSIGSLAALAAFAAAPAVLQAVPEPAIQAAAFSNVELPYSTPGGVHFDIDGDSFNDFYVYSNGYSVVIYTENGARVSDGTVAFGDSFAPGGATTTGTYIDSIPGTFTTGYYGFSVITGANTYAAWVYFDFTGDTPLAVNGAWETQAGASIMVGAIPEPSAAAAIVGASALLGALFQRRRRSANVAGSAS